MKLNKILYAILIALVLFVTISNFASVFAAPTGTTDPAEITGTTGTGSSKVKTTGKKIVGIIQTVGSVAAVVVLIALGIKYMMGSTEEKAEYKKTLMPYVIGAVLVFAASNLASVIYNFAGDI